MHILILSDSYPPEVRSAAQLMKDLAEGLATEGHRVSVVTSMPAYNLAERASAVKLEKDFTENGVRILRTITLPHHRVHFFMRGIAQLVLPFLFFYTAKKNLREKIDVVILHSPPLPLALAAAKIKKVYGARFILNVHDIFPQNAVDLGIMTQWPLIRFFEWMEYKAYRDADLLVVPSESHKRYLNEKRSVSSSKVAVVPHWINIRPFELAKNTGRFRKQYRLDGKFIFLFAGVLGPSQGLELILNLADWVRGKTDIVFLFVGDGSEKERLRELAKQKNLTNVRFESFISSEEYPDLLAEADVGLIVLTEKNTTPAVPAKLIGYMAAGLPVAAFLHNESDGHLIVKEARCGYSALSGNAQEALSVIERLYGEKEQLKELGKNARAYVRKYFQKEICVKQWAELLE